MQTAIMIAISNDKNNEELRYQLDELKNLALACNIIISDEMIQNIPKPAPLTYIGKGKLQELRETITSEGINLVIANNELSPSQIKHLSEFLEAEIYDRTFLILEIFRSRAKTKEAQLQVEAALLKYTLPRLTGMHKNLSRQRGTTAQGTAGGRGAGETKLELDRRKIKNRLTMVQKELAKLLKRRKQQRVKRKKNMIKTVSLVGYTNSGKSSLLNAFLKYTVAPKKNVYEDDALFATLETSTRLIRTPNNVRFLITDTVGFVDEIPHNLIEAFKSTLEEVGEADLLIHVVDIANPNFEKHIKTTNHVLEELGVGEKPTIYAMNKIDLLDNDFIIPGDYHHAMKISATNDINIEALLAVIEDELFSRYINVKLTLPSRNANIISQIKHNAIIKTMDFASDDIIIEAKMSEDLYNEILPHTKNNHPAR